LPRGRRYRENSHRSVPIACRLSDGPRLPFGPDRPTPGGTASMPVTEPRKIRNVAVVGHRGVGKTSLVEAMLFQSGKTNRLGSVQQGTTVSDWDDDEQKRQMSLSGTLENLDWHDRKINVIDAPGDAGFQADTYA